MKERYSVRRDVLFTQLDDGTGVLLNLGSGLYYTLNRAGVVVWKALSEEKADISTLTQRLCASFDVDEIEAEREASRLVHELQKDSLVQLVRD